MSMIPRTATSLDGSIGLGEQIPGFVDLRSAPGWRHERTLSGLASVSIPDAGVTTLALPILGYATPGDCGPGGVAVRYSAVEPTHEAWQADADGNIWELMPGKVQLGAFGADTTGSGDCSAALLRAATWAAAVGGEVHGAKGAVYRLASRVTFAQGFRLVGAGARFDFVSTEAEEALTLAADCNGMIIDDWNFSLARTGQKAIKAGRVDDLLLDNLRVAKGALVQVAPDAAPTSAAGQSNNVTVRGAVCRGVGAGPDGGDANNVIRTAYVKGLLVEGCDIRDYYAVLADKFSGITWWGGDAGASAFDATRWTEDIRLIGNHVQGVYAGGIWGSMGRGVTAIGNTVEECGDIGIHGEGSDGIVIASNVIRNCAGGAFSPFFHERNARVYGNVAEITDGAAWGVTLLRQNKSSDGLDFEVDFDGNTFEMRDPGYTGVISCTRGGRLSFRNNRLKNTRINFDAFHAGDRVVEGNDLFFTRKPDGHAIAVGGNFSQNVLGRSMVSRVMRNTITAYGWDAADGDLLAAIFVRHAGAGGNDRPATTIEGNQIWGWRDPDDSYAAKGFHCDILTMSEGSGYHDTDVHNNGVWWGVIADITHRTAGVSAASYPQRLRHRGTWSTRSGVNTPYAAAPTHGAYYKGSKLDFDQPATLGGTVYEGLVCRSSDALTGSANGAYSAAAVYPVFAHVTDSGDVFVAVVRNGPGTSAGVVGPTDTDDGAVWRRFAPSVATWKGRGACEP